MTDLDRFSRAMRLCKEQCTKFSSKFYRLARRREAYSTSHYVSPEDVAFFDNIRLATENLEVVNELLRKQMAIWKWEDKQRARLSD
jgi:hypothetical protein